MIEQVLEEPVADVASEQNEGIGWGSVDADDDFDFVPMSPWAPISLALGFFSLTAFLGAFGLMLSFFSIFIAIGAISRIRAGAGMYRGKTLAVIGLVLASGSLAFGSAKMAYDFSTECPEGYQRVSFPDDIADKQFLYIGNYRRLHPDVAVLEGKQIFLKGFMWETEDVNNLTEFALLKDNGECCMGGKPKPFDVMRVNLAEGTVTRKYPGMVAVAGVLRVNLLAEEGEPVYFMDNAIVEEARTTL